MNNENHNLNSYVNSSHSLISFIKNSTNQWCIKDKESRYIFVNDKAFDTFQFPKKFDYEGRSDKEVPTKICEELWPDFINHDKKVISENRMIRSIDIHFYGKGNICNPIPRLSEKAPLYDNENNIIGVVCSGRRLEVPTLLYYMYRLNRKTIQIDAPNDLFTKRELEIIFWAQQRLGAKEIAKRLDISTKTVEVHLTNIYSKADVHNNIQLIEYCKHTGLDRYIPLDFIKKGTQIID